MAGPARRAIEFSSLFGPRRLVSGSAVLRLSEPFPELLSVSLSGLFSSRNSSLSQVISFLKKFSVPVRAGIVSCTFQFFQIDKRSVFRNVLSARRTWWPPSWFSRVSAMLFICEHLTSERDLQVRQQECLVEFTFKKAA